jgi:hypothetical protein
MNLALLKGFVVRGHGDAVVSWAAFTDGVVIS